MFRTQILIFSLFLVCFFLVQSEAQEVSNIPGPSDISKVLDIIRQRILDEKAASMALIEEKEHEVYTELSTLYQYVQEQQHIVNNHTQNVVSIQEVADQLWLHYNASVTSLPYVLHRYNESVWNSLSDVREQMTLLHKIRRLILALQTGSVNEVGQIDDHIYISCDEAAKKESGLYHIKLKSTNDKMMTTYCLRDEDQSAWTLVWSGASGNVAPNTIKKAINTLPIYTTQTAPSLTFSMYTGLRYWRDVTNKQKMLILASDPQSNGHNAHTRVQCSYALEGPTYKLTIYDCEVEKGEIDLDYIKEQHSDHHFSTEDQDLDGTQGNCSSDHASPFWYGSCYSILPYSKKYGSGRLCTSKGECKDSNV